MKTRSGFVSNSSSSSFICTVAKIVDPIKFATWLEQNPKAAGAYTKCVGPELKCELSCCGDFLYRLMIPRDLKIEETDEFIISSECGNEGDESFSNSRWGDLDYDIDLNWFGDQHLLFYVAEENESGLKIIDQTYYAGRNG